MDELYSRHIKSLQTCDYPIDIFSSPKVRREMMPEVDSFNPFVSSQNRRGHPRSYSQYYEGKWLFSSSSLKALSVFVSVDARG